MGLTADVDDLVGTANDDTFNARLDATGSQTFTEIDSIDGGAGTDTLNASLLDNFGVIADSVQNVENFYLRSLGDSANTVNFAGYQGAEQIWSDLSSQSLTVNGVAGPVAVGLIRGSDSTFTVNYADPLAATAEQAIFLDRADGTITFTNAGAVRNVTINNTGDSEVAIDKVNDGNIRNLVIAGDGALELTTAITAGIVDASAATADLTLTIAAAAPGNQATGTDRDVTLGAGDDVVDVTAGLAEVDSIDGGAGRDTLIVDGSSATIAQDVLDVASNFEVLQLNDFNQTISANILNAVGYQEYILEDANAGTLRNISAANDIALVNTDVTADAVTLNVASGVEELSVTAENDHAGTGTFDIITNASSVTVDFVANSDSTGVTLDLTETAATDELASVTITGEEDVTFDGSALADLESVNASALDGDADITVANGVQVTTGAGEDTITFGEASVITGGDGDDTFVVGASVSGNAGLFSRITDFEDGDTIDFGAAVANFTELTKQAVFGEDNATFAGFVEAAASRADGDISFFVFEENTYLVVDRDGVESSFQGDSTPATPAGDGDQIVRLNGVYDFDDLEIAGGDIQFA